MNAVSGSIQRSPRSSLAPVFAGGILSAAIDLTYACTYHGFVNNIPPVRILQRTLHRGVKPVLASAGRTHRG